MSTETAPAVAAATPQPAPAVQAATAAPQAAPPVAPVPVQLVIAPPIAQPVQAAPAVAPPTIQTAEPDPEKEPEKEPKWLAKKLERDREAQRRKYLESLGVSEDEIKVAIQARKEQEDAKKSLEQKALEASQALDAERKRVVEYHNALRGVADSELGKLTEPQRAAVAAVAGDDPTRVLATIRVMSPTWAATPPIAAPAVAAPTVIQAAPMTQPVVQAAPPAAAPMLVQLPNGQLAQVVPIAPQPATPAVGTQAIPPSPVSTAPIGSGPTPPAGQQPPTALQQYQALMTAGKPAAAAEFFQRHIAELEKELSKQ